MAVGSGIRIAAFPAAVISASVVAPGAADDQVGACEPPAHVVEERLDVGLKPGLPVGGADHLHISFARLVGETKSRTAGRQLRRCLHHGHVDCVRALRAAKD